MAKLGADLNSALSFTNIFNDKDDTYSTHPSISKRINAVRKGFNKAGGNSSLANTNNAPTEYTRKNTNMSVEEYINRGIERRDSNNYNGAISDFTAAIRIKPDYGFAYFQRAYAKDELKDYYGAIEDLSKAIELDPDDAIAYSNRKIAKGNLKDYYGAIGPAWAKILCQRTQKLIQ
ncbi:tetratricopeptide repeat protein [Flavobacteriaceae bacterium]|nr:tetratricopeptide repeat protein [Flavobacteriaceae bacterium]